MSKPMLIEYNGEVQTAGEWGKKFNTSSKLIRRRINSGWNVHDALTKPVHTKKYTVNGKVYTLTELAKITGLPKSTIINRLKSGMDISLAVKFPSKSQNKPCATFKSCFSCPYDDCIIT